MEAHFDAFSSGNSNCSSTSSSVTDTNNNVNNNSNSSVTNNNININNINNNNNNDNSSGDDKKNREMDEILVKTTRTPIHKLLEQNCNESSYGGPFFDTLFYCRGDDVTFYNSIYYFQTQRYKEYTSYYDHYRILHYNKSNGEYLVIKSSNNSDYCQHYFNKLKDYRERLKLTFKVEPIQSTPPQTTTTTTKTTTTTTKTTTTTTTVTKVTTTTGIANNTATTTATINEHMSESEMVENKKELQRQSKDRYAIIIGNSIEGFEAEISKCMNRFGNILRKNSFKVVTLENPSVVYLQKEWNKFLETIGQHTNNLDIIVFVTGTCYYNPSGDLVSLPCKDLNQATFIKDMATRLKENVKNQDSNTLFIIDAKRNDIIGNNRYESPDTAFLSFGGGGIAFLLPCYQDHVCYFTNLFCDVLEFRTEFTLIKTVEYVQMKHQMKQQNVNEKNVNEKKTNEKITNINLVQTPHYGDIKVGGLIIVEKSN